MTERLLASAELIAREAFGLEGEVTPLAGELDLNFLLTGTNSRHVLKLSPANRAPVLDLSTSCLAHLEQHTLPFELPRALKVVGRDEGPGNPFVAGTELEGVDYVAAALSYVPGSPAAGLNHRPPELLAELGSALAELDQALESFDHPSLTRAFPWRLDTGTEVVSEHLPVLQEADRYLVERVTDRVRVWLDCVATDLPTAVIHNDANDYNVMVNTVRRGGARGTALSGLIDFGDVVNGWRVAEPAVAAAYLAMGLQDPVEATGRIAGGYAKRTPLNQAECAALLPLVALRLCISISVQARQIQAQPDNAYLAVSQEPARKLLTLLDGLDWHTAECRIRAACGHSATSSSSHVVEWIAANPAELSSIVEPGLLAHPVQIDLSVESTTLPHPEDVPNGPALDAWVADVVTEARATVGIGRYGEARLLYADPAFEEEADPVSEARTIHMGLDLFLPEGTPVHAPLSGEVVGVIDNAGNLDYGPTVLLRHQPSGAPTFYTLYGHLDEGTLEHLNPGDSVQGGDVIGWLGGRPVNGGWTPHLHVQIVTENEGSPPSSRERLLSFAGVARPSVFLTWETLCPNPAGLCGSLPGILGQTATSRARSANLLARRTRHLGPSLSLSYRRPLHIVRGLGTRLYDVEGRGYLDTINNVAHVGHSNRRVAQSIARQTRTLNTNSRYLHDEILALAEELVATFPAPLEVIYFVCSGSEANELALRMAKTATGKPGVVALEGGYHGNSAGLIGVSHYKFSGPGGTGPGPHVAIARSPDSYRENRSAEAFAETVESSLQELEPAGAAAFLCEPILSCGGQIEPPPGYLTACYASARKRGALCIADEVQIGFGRVGDAFWGFQIQDVVPDIVTLGKPMGNGHPVGAVVTTRAVADAFDNGMEYFNTFGGNPVSCAAARAVLAEIQEHGLQEHAAVTGGQLVDRLRELQVGNPIIGDIRGRGLFLGVEFVKDLDTKEPATEEARFLVERMRDRRVLCSIDGPDRNVLKIKPPLVFSGPDIDLFTRALGGALADLG
ncbi:MAG: aminotransferase class III-fold pyridoxal phosphate-dependent enzyme [Longimicrobiales bacterium]